MMDEINSGFRHFRGCIRPNWSYLSLQKPAHVTRYI